MTSIYPNVIFKYEDVKTSDRLSEILTTLRQQILTAPNGDRLQAMKKHG